MSELRELVIRDVLAADRDRLIEMFADLNRFEQPLSGDRRMDPDGAIAGLGSAELRVAESGGVAMVAVLGQEVVGHVFVTVERFGAHVREDLRSYAYVAELFVCAPHRRRGIGAALVAAAERFARARGLRRMLIGVLAGNDAAHEAYRGYGFRLYACELIKDLDPAAV
ncbi:MAG: N-acetyltransferase family protein [Gammaproteobacteria bacterium]